MYKSRYINLIKYIIANIFILVIIYLLYLKKIRICPIYNLFKVPCPGCGITTSLVYLLKGDILASIQYNIITIPLIITYTMFSMWYFLDIITNKNTLKKWVNKRRNLLIIFCIGIFIITLTRNLTNPILY